MLHRIAYVLWSYVTRPLVWVLGVAYAAVFCWAVNLPLDRVEQSAVPELPQPGRVLYLTDPEAIEKFDRGVFVRNAGTAVIYWFPENAGGRTGVRVFPDGRREEVYFPLFSAKHLRQLGECPRLKSLTLRFRSQLKEDEWQALGELNQLEAFKYDGVVTPQGMRQICRLTKLRHLDLSGCTFSGGFEELESLAHLQTLVLETFFDNGVHVLAELHRLPRLHTLACTGYLADGSKLPHGVWESDLGELQGVASLRRWFVDEKERGFPGFDVLQRGLARVAVRPTRIDARRQFAVAPVVLLTLLLGFLLTLQMTAEFAHPAALLTPGYAAPHLLAPASLWLCGTLAHTWFLAAHRIPCLPGLGISMAMWLSISGPAVLGLFSIKPPAAGVLMVFPLGLCAWLYNLSSVDWYLRGHEPVLALALIAMAMLSCAEFARQIRRLHSRLQEMGVETPPLGFNVGAMQAWKQRAAGRQDASRRLRLFSIFQPGRGLARAIAQAGSSVSFPPGWWRRSRLWIAGNTIHGMQAVVYSLAFGLVVFVGNRLPQAWQGNGFDVADQPDPLMPLGLMILPDAGMLYLGMVWRMRRPLLAMESLRSVSRLQFVREQATALACDFLPFVVFHLAITVLFTALADEMRWSPVWTAALALQLVGRGAVMCGAMFWLNSIRRGWVALLIAFSIGYLYLFASAFSGLVLLPVLGVNQLPPDLPILSHGLLLWIGVAWSLVAALTMALACRRWRTIELG